MSSVVPSDQESFVKPGGCAGCCLSCCCLDVRPRSSIPEFMLQQDTGPSPSLFDRCCFCVCSAPKRTLSGVEKVPEISALAGATLQTGTHATGGSVQTLKWCKYDAEKRVARISVFGGAGGVHRGESGLWTEPVSWKWAVLIRLGKLCDYTYRFEFSEDYKKIDMRVMANCCCLCPLCLPCCPAWFTIPKSLTQTIAEMKEGSENGAQWKRLNKGKHYYDLVQVFKPDGSIGVDHTKLAEFTPATIVISR